MKKPPLSILPTVVCALLILWSSARGQQILPFQGRLSDASGQPIPDGARLIQFQIFSEPSGGGLLWAGEVHRATVNSGLVNVMLGSRNALPRDRSDQPGKSFFDQQLYLQITVDANKDNQIDAADAPLLPRQTILPLPFAAESGVSRNSQKLAGYDWSALFGVNSPAGTINGSRIENITSNSISPGTINAGLIARGSITSNQIAPLTISANEIADGAITQAKRAPANIQISDVGSFACEACSSDAEVPNLTVTLTTRGGPVFVGLVSAPSGDDTSYIMFKGGTERTGRVMIFDGAKAVASAYFWTIINQASATGAFPVSTVNHVYFPDAGTHTFKVKIRKEAGGVMIVNLARLVAYEL